MGSGRYYTHNKDGLLEVYELESCLSAIRQRNKDNEDKIAFLTEQNRILKEDYENYRAEELKKMREEVKNAREDLSRGFGITEEESKKIRDWKEKHEREVHGLDTLSKKVQASGAIGGRYSYNFVPTSIGVIGTIKCTCGEEFTFCVLS